MSDMDPREIFGSDAEEDVVADGYMDDAQHEAARSTGDRQMADLKGNDGEKLLEEKPKKRVFLKDMTPNSKEQELERRKQVKRDNSNAWHQKWTSKGVPREPQNDEQVGDTHQDEPAGSHEEPPPQEADGFKVDPEILNKAIKTDMRSVRSNFMNQWMEWKQKQDDFDGDVEKLRKVASEKWLKSALRAQMSAGRKGSQF